MLAVMCPGQAAQTPGFLRPWLGVDGVQDTLRQLSTRAYVDLVELGSDPDADVVDTAVAQPLLVAAGVVTARLLGPLPQDCVVVGHSVGELTAGCVADVFTPAAAIDVARERGRAMAIASAVTPSGMAAVLGGDAAVVADAIASAGCWVANHNGAGQIVAAGTTGAIERLIAAPPPGARVRALAVAGAFHTPLMAGAQRALADFLADVQLPTPARAVVSNADGAVVVDGNEFARRLVEQVTRPVRFDQCIETLQSLSITAAIEVAPGGVLGNLLRRALPDVQVVTLRSPDDLGDALELVNAHQRVGEQWEEAWRLLVAPVTGTLLLPDDADERATAFVTNRSGNVPVPRGDQTRIVEWLAHDGDPVREGQPLARFVAAAP